MSLTTSKFSVFLFDPEMNVIPFEHFKESHPTALVSHKQEYRVGIFNHDPSRVIDARVEIDGTHIGTFRVNKSSSQIIERPVNLDRKLTFFKVISEEGDAAHLRGNPHAGTIVVEISAGLVLPELVPRSAFREIILNKETKGFESFGGHIESDGFESFAGRTESDGLERGGTGLGTRSHQRFRECESLSKNSERFILMGQMKVKPTIDIVPLTSFVPFNQQNRAFGPQL